MRTPLRFTLPHSFANLGIAGALAPVLAQVGVLKLFAGQAFVPNRAAVETVDRLAMTTANLLVVHLDLILVVKLAAGALVGCAPAKGG